MLIIESALILFGFFLLIKSGDYLVESAEIIARHFGLSELVIGLTIVAFGTSAPELMVNIQSAVNKIDGFVLGNIFGSNIINILLALGISGLITPLKIKSSTIKIEAPFLAFVTFLMSFLLLDHFWTDKAEDIFSTYDAIIMLFFFAAFLLYNVRISKQNADIIEKPRRKEKIAKATLIFFLSCVGLHFGSDFIVNNADIVGQRLDIPKSIMGLTVLAIGTSLPEIVVSIRSAQRGSADIAVGGMIGSNLFNILLVLSVSALIHPPKMSSDLVLDMIVLNSAAFVLFIFIRFTKDSSIYKRGSSLFLTIYIVYLLLKFVL